MDITIDITKTTIETDRLILRAWQETDVTDFYEYASVPGVGEMAGWKPHDSIEVSEKILQSFISGKYVFAIVYKENNKVIGSLGLHKSWANGESSYAHLKSKEIGYVLSKAYWGKGLMPEAVTSVIRFCFDKCKLEALTIGHFSSNNQSRRVIEKCGFTFVKESECFAKQLELTFDDMKYILLNKTNLQRETSSYTNDTFIGRALSTYDKLYDKLTDIKYIDKLSNLFDKNQVNETITITLLTHSFVGEI